MPCIYFYISIYICVYIYIYVCIYIYVHIYIYPTGMYVCVFACDYLERKDIRAEEMQNRFFELRPKAYIEV